MKITFYGGARTVTGSMFLLEVNNKKILLECGLFQGKRHEMYERNKNFKFDPSTIDALILSHAHIDHSGNVPNLVKNGFHGKIYATSATVELCEILLRDSAHLQLHDVEVVNKIRKKQKQEPVHILYSAEDVENCLPYFVSVSLDSKVYIADNIAFTLREAGHILGSASVEFDIREKGKYTRLGFTGDLGRNNVPIIRDPNRMQDLDILITESTYGMRRHTNLDDSEEELAKLVNEAISNGGKLIIPCFAVGRTQHLVYVLHKLFNENRIPDVPIFVDSPLASKATDIFRQHQELYDRETKRIFTSNSLDSDPFGFSRLQYITSSDDSKKLMGLTTPHIIISSSGMCEGGRILYHLKNSIGDPNCTVLFVGYAADHTLARSIIQGDQKVTIIGEECKVNAKIRVMGAFSAHADRKGLLDYVSNCPPERLKHIFIVHGEPIESESLIDAYRSKGYKNVYYPNINESFTL